MTEDRIKRINELYHKSQKEGLTAEEKEAILGENAKKLLGI